MKIKVILDTNILISALLFGGKPRKILNLIRDGSIEGYISPFIIFELKEILYNKFEFFREELDKIEELIKDCFLMVYPKNKSKLIESCTADNQILDCAIEAKIDYLITGDAKHILKIGKIGKTKIISAAQFIEISKSSKTN